MMNTPPRSDVEPSLTPSRDATEGPSARQGDSTPISIPNPTEDSAADGLMDLFSSEQPDYQTLSSTLGSADQGGPSVSATSQNNDLDVFGFDEVSRLVRTELTFRVHFNSGQQIAFHR